MLRWNVFMYFFEFLMSSDNASNGFIAATDAYTAAQICEQKIMIIIVHIHSYAYPIGSILFGR